MQLKSLATWMLTTTTLLSICSRAASAAVPENFVVGPYAISVPLHYFVLVRKGTTIGAFRFTDETETRFDGRLGKSRYESYGLLQRSVDRGWTATDKFQGELDIQELKGFHPFAWQPGQDTLRVGRWRFRCLAPHLVNMSDGFSPEDHGYEFAPTANDEITSIDPTSKQLHWFRIDANSTVTVPIGDLTKSQNSPP